jgi:hypothetical protein
VTDEAPAPNAGAIVAVLNAHGVDYVVIGAFAAQASGAPIPPTLDIDFTPSSRPENLRRVADALRELGARLRVAGTPDGVPFDPVPQLIVQMAMLNLTCRYGDFDLAFHPSGTGGFDDLTVRATTVLIGDTQARVAALADVIRSKRAAARPKDLRVLPTLEQYARSRGIELGAARSEQRRPGSTVAESIDGLPGPRRARSGPGYAPRWRICLRADGLHSIA